MTEHGLIEILVFSTVLAFIMGMIAKKLHLPTILGYLIAGMMIGPHTPGFVGDTSLASQLAEIGIILLMFGVGLHFSPRDLLAIRKIAIPGATIQIISAIVLGTVLAMGCGFTLLQGLIFGTALSVASTVVLLRAMEMYRMVDTPTGKIAIGWLIVEDIAMVVAIVLLPVIADIIHDDIKVPVADMTMDIGIALIKIVAVTLLMLLVGKKWVPRLLGWIVHKRSPELTSLSVMAIALGSAYIAYKVFDASFALGAFLAGMMLNESESGQKVIRQSLPLKNVFAVLFFVSVGMLFDPLIVTKQPFMIVTALLIIVVGKSVAAFLLTKFFQQSLYTCLLVSVSLAQIGEFSFIFAGMARTLDLLPAQLYDVILACALISIAINPFLFKMARRHLTKVDAVQP